MDILIITNRFDKPNTQTQTHAQKLTWIVNIVSILYRKTFWHKQTWQTQPFYKKIYNIKTRTISIKRANTYRLDLNDDYYCYCWPIYIVMIIRITKLYIETQKNKDARWWWNHNVTCCILFNKYEDNKLKWWLNFSFWASKFFNNKI